MWATRHQWSVVFERKLLTFARRAARGFYRKYLNANGIPIMSSGAVPDEALQKFGYIVNMMLRKRPDIRARLVREGIKVVPIARTEVTTDIPEYNGLNTAGSWDWNQRTRGVGATSARPAVSAGVENLMCLTWAQRPQDGDRYFGESISMHEFAHTMLSTFNTGNDGSVRATGGTSLVEAVQAAYRTAMAAGLWANTYSAVSWQEYWGVGTQVWYGVGRKSFVAGVWNGRVNTRYDLYNYDRALYNLLAQVHCDDDWVGTNAYCGPELTCDFSRCRAPIALQPVVPSPRQGVIRTVPQRFPQPQQTVLPPRMQPRQPMRLQP